MPVNGGVKNWTSGQTLDADDLNNYVANQAIARFETIAARTAAYGIAGAPALQTGLFSWVESTGKLYYYDGDSWEEVGAQVEDGEITTAKIADNSVTSAKIASGAIVNANINAAAAIDKTKISGTAITAADTGTVTSAMIADGTIVNADINAAAAIALSKLATSTAGNIIVYNASGVPTSVAETGDVTIDSSGVASISSGVIVNADINAAAAIEIGKIADVTIDTKTANYTLVLTDKNKFIEMNLAGANTVSVPTNASVAFPIGSQIHITQYGAGKTQVVAVTPGTTSIRSTPGSYLRAQYSSATLVKRATDEWYLVGDLSAT